MELGPADERSRTIGQWALWGAYDTPVALTMSTHNLEHGGIVIHYGPDVPQAEVAKLRDFYREDPNAMLLSPLPTAGNKIILSAWYYDESRGDEQDYRGEGKQATGTKVDDGALRAPSGTSSATRAASGSRRRTCSRACKSSASGGVILRVGRGGETGDTRLA